MKKLHHLIFCGLNVSATLLFIASIYVRASVGTLTPLWMTWIAFWVILNCGLFAMNLHNYLTDLK